MDSARCVAPGTLRRGRRPHGLRRFTLLRVPASPHGIRDATPGRGTGDCGTTLALLIREWLRRAACRRQLSEMSAAELKDLGITRDDAVWEARKPCWRP